MRRPTTGALGVVVLGMGRSGTSAVTGMLASAGFFVGERPDLMPATDANPMGHWENMRIYEANEQVLSRLGGSWFDPPDHADQLVAREWALPVLSAAFQAIVGQADGTPIAIKDPRIGVMTPLWHSLIAGRLHPVFVVRNPSEVALSLDRRDGMPIPFALAAWELHITALLDYLAGKVVTVAPYARLTDDPRLGLLVIKQAAAHVEPTRIACLDLAAVRTPEPEHRHNRVIGNDLDAHLTSRQLELWRWLSALPPGDQSIDVPAELRNPSIAARAGVRGETSRLRLVAQLVAETRRRAELELELASERAQSTTLKARLVDEQERAESLTSTLGDEHQRIAAVSSELVSERARADAAVAAHGRAERWLTEVQGSASWRVTAPLRAAKGTFSRLSPKGQYEIHIPISPTPSFLTRIHYLAASLRRFGGALAGAPIVVTVGADEPVDLVAACPWSRRLGVEWRWLDDSLWRRHGIYATALQRFCYDIEAPNVLLLDSDTLFVRPVDDLLRTLRRVRSIAGVVAHLSPFINCDGGQQLWANIFHAAGLGDPIFSCEHPGWQTIELDTARRHCPPYFNLGVLFAPRDIMVVLGRTIFAEMEIVERVHPTLFRCQLALTLAIVRSGVSWTPLSLRFNLPNLIEYLPRYAAELADARIIHYLRDEQFTRMEDFVSVEAVGKLLVRQDLHPINARLRDALRDLHRDVTAAV